MGRLAANISGGEEPSILSANTLMAPNTDSGIFGNPEDHNKFMLTHRSVLQTTGDFSHSRSPSRTLWNLAGSGLLPAGCESVTDWEQVKMGMAGDHLRVVNQGMWQSSTGGGGCGVEVMAVSPPADGVNFSVGNTTALLRVTSQICAPGGCLPLNTSFLRFTQSNDGAGAVQEDELGSDGAVFYAALLAQAGRWGAFIERGAQAHVPQVDRRYTAASNALMTMFMNTDRGLIPQYGAGQFWNTYNIYLPLDSLALNGALVSGAITTTAHCTLCTMHCVRCASSVHIAVLAFLSLIFTTVICSSNGDTQRRRWATCASSSRISYAWRTCARSHTCTSTESLME
jgi:hypothetical protein